MIISYKNLNFIIKQLLYFTNYKILYNYHLNL